MNIGDIVKVIKAGLPKKYWRIINIIEGKYVVEGLDNFGVELSELRKED